MKPAGELMERKDVAMFAAHVRAMFDESDEGDAALYTAQRDIEALIESPGWELVQGLIGMAVETSIQNLRWGAIKDHVEQARDIGVQAGMSSQQAVTKAVLEVARKREQKAAERVREAEAA